MQHEHINAASKLDGYRRTLLYRPVEPTKYGAEDIGSYLVLIHEFDKAVHPDGLGSVRKDMESIGATQDCPFTLRSYSLLSSEGFDGQCRTPERL